MQRFTQVIAFIQLCISHSTAEGKSEEEKKKTITEEYVPNTLNPVLDRINKRLEGKEWIISDKVWRAVP